ncbi:hypothetical protein ACTXT7_001912 [Hymenolepis weldensis]
MLPKNKIIIINSEVDNLSVKPRTSVLEKAVFYLLLSLGANLITARKNAKGGLATLNLVRLKESQIILLEENAAISFDLMITGHVYAWSSLYPHVLPKSRLLYGIQNEEKVGVPKIADMGMTLKMEYCNLKL